MAIIISENFAQQRKRYRLAGGAAYMLRAIKLVVVLSVSVAFGVVVAQFSIAQAAQAGPVELLAHHVVIPHTCRSSSNLSCQQALVELQAGKFSLIPPTATAETRDDPLLSRVFAGCQLAPAGFENGMWDGRAELDPLYISGTAGVFLPFGPFQMYEVPIKSGRTVHVLAATGLLSVNPTLSHGLRDVWYFSLNSKRLCSPQTLGYVGAFDPRDLSTYWSGLIRLRGEPFVVAIQQYCPTCDHFSVKMFLLRSTARPQQTRRITIAFSVQLPK